MNTAKSSSQHSKQASIASILEGQPGVQHRSLPFSRPLWDAVGADKCSYIEFTMDEKLYLVTVKYVLEQQKSKDPVGSFKAQINQKASIFFDPAKIININPERISLTLGLGLHEIEHDGQIIRLLHQIVGEPTSGDGIITQLKTIILFADNSAGGGPALLKSFCNALIEWDERTIAKVYRIYQFNARHRQWQHIAMKLVRPIESVILPESLKKKLLADVDNFADVETARWYSDRGISYKRTYMFYGPPGAGKSSFIRVLAGHLGRNLCFLQPADPMMTDESLQLCLQQAPENAIVVIEDIDALFDENREKKIEGCPLTFSGLLNALDGVANRDGQIFVLTTNFIDKLDRALIRPGRVDLQVQFPSANAEQVRGLFLFFYPEEFDSAEKFTAKIVKRYGLPDKEGELDGKLSMAAVQQFLIYCRLNSAAEAVEKLDEFSFHEA